MDESLVPLIEAAVRAPSSHNTQPWLFRIRHDAVEVLADRNRALPVNDPFDRELTISCGAALLNLRVAAAREGLACAVELCPTEGDPDLLARVVVRAGGPDDRLANLGAAIDARQTTREAFTEEPLQGACVEELVAAAAAEGVRLRIVDEAERERVAALVARGDRLQFGDPGWRRELAGWMRPRRKGDGLANSAFLPLTRFVVRHFDLGDRVAIGDEARAREAPFLAAIVTERDDAETWMRAGQGLERLLLTAAARGVQAGFLNQPCQLDELRPELAHALAVRGMPQILVRLGFPRSPRKRSPRRAIEEVALADEGARSRW